MITIQSVVWFVVYAVGLCIIFGLLNYFVDKAAEAFPSIAQFAKFIKLGLLLLAILVVIGIIMSLLGHPLLSFNGGMR